MNPASPSSTETLKSKPASAHEQLRSSTDAMHRLIESQLNLASLRHPRAYRAFLLSNWPVVSIETALERAGIRQVLPDWEARSRRECLVADLRHYGISSPDIFRLDIPPDRGTLLGWSYVLEGSRLGAGVILQELSKSTENARQGTAFLRHGSREPLWRSFKSSLSAIDEDASAISRACVAANLAFRCFLHGARTTSATNYLSGAGGLNFGQSSLHREGSAWENDAE
ncbi:biliverdin-producing heme oxygenase [Bradyrhizobium japonicum]|uniref:biliverdin-producing heme oxygenase n=1 Tax=Bradyrhizobium japonicum TaxID=375 RepID=UPI001BA642E9|nr:biliverdin-producing heme oxygenase [Bradyrhizobium japonicum]MBR0994633.1 biliverdin-producing heme oxygenase [Bradyrhizobium japonicum]